MNTIDQNIPPDQSSEAMDTRWSLPTRYIVGIAIVGGLFGILGAVLTVPLLATLREIMRFLYAKILGEDPFPKDEENEDRESLTESARPGNVGWYESDYRLAPAADA